MRMEYDPFGKEFDSLETLADAINDVLGCPATIEDNNHRLLAYSSHNIQLDPVRIASIISKRVPEKIVSSLWLDGVIRQLTESRGPLRMPANDEVGIGQRVAIAIRNNEDVLGTIWVMENEKQLSDLELFQLTKAAQAASTKLMQLQNQRKKKEEEYKFFLWMLLTGHFTAPAQIKQKARDIGISLPPLFQVLVVQASEEMEEKLARQIRTMLEASPDVQTPLYVIDHNRLIMLCSPSFQQTAQKTYTKSLTRLIGKLESAFPQVMAGCGSLAEEYEKAKKSFQEAQSVLLIKHNFPDKRSRIVQYSDLGYYRFLPMIKKEVSTESFNNANLQQLVEYDREHNSNLVDTLEVFLRYDCNVKLAAEILHIHVNTLNYRLKRISDIGRMDLTDMDQKVTLYLELRAVKLAES